MTNLATVEVETSPSPFLPGTNVQYAWDSTSLGFLKTCPRLYQYIMIDGWGSRDESVHLRFGIEYHKALEEYDQLRAEGLSHNDALRPVVRNLLLRTKGWEPDPDTRAGKYKNRTSLLRLVVDYVDKYEHDQAETVILGDGSAAVELSFRFELDWGPQGGQAVTDTCDTFVPYILCGHLDKVVTFSDDLFVLDRKTSMSTIGPYYFAQYEPHNQMSLYSLAAKVTLASPIKGVIIDAAQILVSSSAFARGFTYRTQDQLEEWIADLKYWLTLAEQYAVNNYWPMNDTSCGMYGGCRFREICSKSPQVRDKFLNSNFDKLDDSSRWNPLKIRGGDNAS